jgi:ABC-2 type transport system ATP-binding protein
MSVPALEIRDLCKTYAGGVEAIRDISLQVAEGEFFGLLGPNGAGKTTTIGVITSLVFKTSGTVKVFGIDIDRDFSAAKRLTGLVPQEMNFSIFEKVQDIVCQQAGYYGIPRRRAAERAEYYLRQLGLWEKRNVQARELSGGMKRRLMIARGLVHDPKLLILDEPTAGVDVELRRGMWEFLANLNRQGRTIILTTHYLEEAEQLCNRIAIIAGGRLIEHTDKRELLKKLDRQTYILDMKTPVRQVEPLDTVLFTIVDEVTLEVTLMRERSLNDVFTHLDRQGLVVDSMRPKANRLEEIFVGMVQ